MKDTRIPSQQVDVVEIMKKIRQTATSNRMELTTEERTKREAKSEFLSLVQAAQVPEFMVEQIRQQTVMEPYDPRTLYASSRPGVGSVIGLIRKILRPITKLFINLDPMAHELNRLTIMNNFYLKSMQDLIAKTSMLRVEMHSMKRRPSNGPQRPHREGSYSRSQGPDRGQGQDRDRDRNQNPNYRRSRHPRRDNSNEPRRTAPRPQPSEEPQAQ